MQRNAGLTVHPPLLRVDLEPVGTTVEATATATSTWAVSGKFVAATGTAPAELMTTDPVDPRREVDETIAVEEGALRPRRSAEARSAERSR